MLMIERHTAAVFVDRSAQQWVVRDPDGAFWMVPCVEHPWEHREPFEINDDVELEPVPGHYKSLLGIPF